MNRNYKELLNSGNKAQIEKLLENEHKSGWDDIPIMELFTMLNNEVAELSEALYMSAEEIRREAADVANFAHMIILACDKEMEG